MKVGDIRDLLNDKRVIEEIKKHLWIESQKAGCNVGLEKATDEWLTLYSEGWMKYHMPEKYAALQAKAAKTKKNKKGR